MANDIELEALEWHFISIITLLFAKSLYIVI